MLGFGVSPNYIEETKYTYDNAATSVRATKSMNWTNYIHSKLPLILKKLNKSQFCFSNNKIITEIVNMDVNLL